MSLSKRAAKRLAALLSGLTVGICLTYGLFSTGYFQVRLFGLLYLAAFLCSGAYYMYFTYLRDEAKRPRLFDLTALGFYLGSMMLICLHGILARTNH
jgi:hypothetical protein